MIGFFATLPLTALACGDDAAPGPSGTGAGSSVGGSGAAGGNGGGGVDLGCIPNEAGDAVDDTCGVFVSSGMGDDDSGDGTKDAPYATIAVAAATGNNVYACAETFDETAGVALAGGQSLFGGLDCADGWKHGETKTALNGPVDAIALVIGGDGSGRVEDMAITAADAEQAGGSSIAVLVDGSTVSFARCELTAGDGADGAAGTTPSDALPESVKGVDGEDGCLAGGQEVTEAPPSVDCGGGMNSTGGSGGNGLVTSSGPGGDGASTPSVSGPAANGGSGQTDTAQCVAGDQGANGDPGPSGAGAEGQGTLSASGFVGLTGQDGQGPGTPGQGGGGGGGARGDVACSNMTFAGPSGGTGGTGGCGGQPATGGGAGGASIALAAVAAGVTLTATSLVSGTGGGGGVGGNGQSGGTGKGGGQSGTGDNNNACAGGQGGTGGRGGSGGGGLGGHSVGLAFVGTAPALDRTSTVTPGTAGTGGVGGDGDTDAGGATGQSCTTLDFDNETCDS